MFVANLHCCTIAEEGPTRDQPRESACSLIFHLCIIFNINASYDGRVLCMCMCVHAGVFTPFCCFAWLVLCCCLLGTAAPYQLHCYCLPHLCYYNLNRAILLLTSPVVSLSIYIFFEFELRLLFTRLHHDITVDRPGATSVRTVYTCFFIPRTECTPSTYYEFPELRLSFTLLPS